MLRADVTAYACLIALGLAGCKSPAPEQHPAPASVIGRKPESEVARVTLTAQAEQRLGLVVGQATRRASPRARTVGADVVPSSGHSSVIVAPIAGRLATATTELRAGQSVRRGAPLLRLTPVASVDRDLRANAERNVTSAEARLVALDARLARAEKLLATGAGSAKAVEEARAERDAIAADLDAAKRRVAMLERSPLEADVAVTLRAPEDGVIRAVSAAPSTLVPAGAPLFELVGTSALWVRVNVFVGELRAIRRDAAALVRPLTASPSAADVEALPVAGAPAADPSTASVDLYFALPKEAAFLPGERVAATLSYAHETSGVGVPAAALVRDVSGNAWVYVAAEHAFERRRVEVERVEAGYARLARGLDDGTRIVVDGAAELFAFEFGTGK